MRRITELDAIRGLAAVAVMVYHLRPQAFALSGIRVDLFFVLSGYLVTSIVLNKGRTPGFLPAFFLRRGLRIWPLYYLSLGALVLVNPWLPKPFPMDGLPYYLTFTQNVTRYWSSTVPPFHWYFLHTWSLAVEEQFYLFWPALVVAVGRRRLPPVALALVALAATTRSLGLHWWLLPARCDGFGFGALLACTFLDREWVDLHRRRLGRAFGLATLAALAFVVATVAFTWGIDLGMESSPRSSLVILAFNVFYFSILGLVLLNAGHPDLRILRDRRLVTLGRLGYGIYLYHPPVFIVLMMAGRGLGLGEPLWLHGLKLVASVAVAALSWRFVEQPILAWRERVRPGSASRPAPAGGPARWRGAEA